MNIMKHQIQLVLDFRFSSLPNFLPDFLILTPSHSQFCYHSGVLGGVSVLLHGVRHPAVGCLGIPGVGGLGGLRDCSDQYKWVVMTCEGLRNSH